MLSNTITSPIRTKSPINLRNSGVLSLSELNKMKQSALLESSSGQLDKRTIEKAELYEKSMSRVKNWPNTIQALRKKKEEGGFERFKKEEEERIRIDNEEAKYQAEVKKKILEKANKQIYESDNRVRALQSKLLLSDIHEERDMQIFVNNKKKEVQKMIDQQYLENEKEQVKKLEEKEQQKKHEKELQRAEQVQFLKQQETDVKLRYFKGMQEQKIEGETLKKKVEEELEKQKIEKEERRQKAIEIKNEIFKKEELLKEIKKQEKERELQKEKEIEAFTKQKEEIMEVRKMREELKFNERQALKQRMIDAQIERMKQIQNKEEETLRKQMKEVEQRAEEIERIKKEKLEQLAKSVERHSCLQIERKKLEKEKELMEAKFHQELWRQKSEELFKQELAEKTKVKEMNQELHNYHLLQAANKKKKEEDEFRKDLEDAERMKFTLEEDDKVFKSFAEMCIKEWDSKGKNIKPLLCEMQKYKK